jgi:hypothetical protein
MLLILGITNFHFLSSIFSRFFMRGYRDTVMELSRLVDSVEAIGTALFANNGLKFPIIVGKVPSSLILSRLILVGL